MKRLAAVLALMLCLVLCCGCVLNSLVRKEFYAKFPSGFTSKEEHFDPDGFQDYTDYCKYVYPDAEGFKADKRFLPVSEVGAENVAGYFENFRDWMESADRLGEYDFDPACISDDDLVQISTREGEIIGSGETQFRKYDDYTVWFFDIRTCTMYYIHNNI